ncbi:MAG: response regulator transcription factor [Bacteroidales bacterium]|nr:response regulator transcription factor [Bacteroidales bacterium]
METKQYSILLVDDEPDIVDFISYNLKKEGYLVSVAYDGKEALEQVAQNRPHLILLDVMMPGMDGFEVCQTIRKDILNKDIIIVFLSARGEDDFQVNGFQVGADDYITKPIVPKVLLCKIQALLKRAETNAKNNNTTFDNIIVNTENYTVTIDNKSVFLPKKEFELLVLLTSNPDKVFKREEIYTAIWGDEIIVGDRTIDVHVRRLREKLGNNKITTIKGVGYKYENK